MPVFCFLKESTLLASGPVSHPFLSVPQHLPWLSVSAVSHYNAVLLLEELISSPPSSSSLCLPAVGVHRLTHLPVIFPIAISHFLLWSSQRLHYRRCLSWCILLQSLKRDRHHKRHLELVAKVFRQFCDFSSNTNSVNFGFFRTDFNCLCHTKKCFFSFFFLSSGLAWKNTKR